MDSIVSDAHRLPSLQELNEIAIDHLVQGESQNAVCTLRQALEVARLSCGQGRRCLRDPYHVQKIHLNNVQESLDGRNTSINDFIVYKGVFTVRKPKSQNQADATLTDDIETLVLLYNFAFTLHKDALQDKSGPNEKRLEKALSIYKMANVCLHGIPLDEHPELNILILALLANQGHIYSTFFRQEAVKFVHDQIEYVLSYIDPDAIEEEDYFFFQYVALISSFTSAKLPPMA